MNTNNIEQYKAAKMLIDSMANVILPCSQNEKPEKIEHILLDGYKMLDGNTIDTTDKSKMEQKYINRLNSIRDREHALECYERCIKKFICLFQATDRQLKTNEVLNSCIMHIREYNNNKTRNI